MDLRDLSCVVGLADTGSFTRAAAALHIDVSTLSRRIGNLENELGALLFERNRAGLLLTSSGREVLQLARRALADVDTIRALASQNGRAAWGDLRLATQMSTLGPKMRAALLAWRKDHPNVQLELVEAHDSQRPIASQIHQHQRFPCRDLGVFAVMRFALLDRIVRYRTVSLITEHRLDEADLE